MSVFPMPFAQTFVKRVRTLIGHDADANDVYGDVDQNLAGCAFDPGTSSERVQGMDQVTVKPTLYAPPGTVITPVDAFLINGEKYEVDGFANTFASPFTGWQPGVVVNLKRVTG